MRSPDRDRSPIKLGVLSGLMAGAIFAIAEMIAAAAVGASLITPWRMFASVVLGSAAIEATSPGVAFIVGFIVHFLVASIFGLIYGAIHRGVARDTRRSYGAQAAIGAIYGLALYLVNIQVIARLAYPWFHETGQWTQALLHAFTYGLPLGLLMATAERRVERPVGVPRTV